MSKVNADVDLPARISDAEKDYLFDCFRKMLQIRTIEQQALDLSRETPPAILGSIHLCAGQEAVPVASIAGLQDTDQIVATYRGHGWALASGLSITEVLGEICQRTVGINGGRGGSAYMMAPWTRFIGENSIVGAGVPIACGLALADKIASNGQVALVTVGEGAFNQGSTHEGLAFAAARSLPLIVICENNGWSELTPSTVTYTIARIAQRAGGYGIPGVTIDGTDPVAIRDTIRHFADRARNGGGPAVIECRVPRLWGHYNRDIEHYRSKEDRQAAADRDPIALLSTRLRDSGAADSDTLDRIANEVRSQIQQVVRTVFNSPVPDASTARDHVWAVREPSAPSQPAESVEPRNMSYLQAINEALSRELQARPEVIVYGEDVGQAGGIFGASRGLQKTWGAERVFDTPISESAILGSAIGAALRGMKPIVEIMWADFMLVALDQLINQAANIRYITSGRSSVPMVVRTQQGATPGSCAQHSQSLEALLAHIPGLRIAVPSTPQDAYTILRSAVADPDPCVIFEARSLYQTSGPVVVSDQIEPIGRAELRKPGTDAVIVTWGTMVRPSLEAAALLEAEGRDVGVLDLRWLSPLDEKSLREAVTSAQGRVVVAHEANVTGGFGAEIVARLHESLRDTMTIKATRVGAPDIRMPASPALSQELLPNASRIAAAVRSLLNPAA